MPNPIPAGCDREERKKRLERDLGRRESCPGGNISFVERESNKRAGCELKELRQRRREERLEPEHEFRKRKEREALALIVDENTSLTYTDMGTTRGVIVCWSPLC